MLASPTSNDAIAPSPGGSVRRPTRRADSELGRKPGSVGEERAPQCGECVLLVARLRETEAALQEKERLLRAKEARIQMLEQRLAYREERQTPSEGCPRCAQVAHALERFQGRMRDQAEELTASQREVTTLSARVETVEKRNTELEQKRHRSAAPFRRDPTQRKPDPKPTGAKKGHAPHFRGVPPEAEIEEETVPLDRCPHCGGGVKKKQWIEQVIVEIPLLIARYTRLRTESGDCEVCGRVRSTHPLQVSEATGAAGVQLGPNASALAVDLCRGHGLTTRRVCRILGEYFHLPLTQGGLCQLLARAARRLQPEFERLRQEVRNSQSVHSDETSWWLAGRSACLWVVATSRATLYHISRKRDTATLEAILGEQYAGTLVSDCLNIYDRYAAKKKSKCVAHHQRAIAEAQERVAASAFLTAMKRLMGAALKLQSWSERLPEEVYRRGVESMERRLTKLLEPRYPEKEEERIAERFRTRREDIFTFLHDPSVAATNNLAERQLRPAIITRKLSCGNQTEAGARTWEVLTSLAATCRQRGESFLAMVANSLKAGGPGRRASVAPTEPAPGHG